MYSYRYGARIGCAVRAALCFASSSALGVRLVDPVLNLWNLTTTIQKRDELTQKDFKFASRVYFQMSQYGWTLTAGSSGAGRTTSWHWLHLLLLPSFCEKEVISIQPYLFERANPVVNLHSLWWNFTSYLIFSRFYLLLNFHTMFISSIK